MKIVFSRHARKQMKWRKIHDYEVESVIDSPDSTEESLKGRVNACKAVRDRSIKVTYKQESDIQIIVITAIVKD